jgi:hypothetical protein
MKYRTTFMVGAAVGYVLGTRAGKERYEQIKRASHRVAENLQLQGAAETLRTQAGEVAGTARERVSGTLHDRFGDKVDKIPGLQRDPGTGQPRQPTSQTTPTSH